jgi:hypothetical protein|tara:strand:- start:1594 stop:2016 length:423 start_codon:yes stop_codon:yes gene_type:complete
VNFDQIEKALQAPTMEAVIALSERVQTLEAHPEGMVFTVMRDVDNTLAVDYSDNLDQDLNSYSERGFRVVAYRRGTRREQRLLLLTLKEIGLNSSYGPRYFEAVPTVISHLRQLGWPMGNLLVDPPGKKHAGNRVDDGFH